MFHVHGVHINTRGAVVNPDGGWKVLITLKFWERFTDSMRASRLFSWVVARLCLTPLSKPFFQRPSSLDLSYDISCWLGKEMQLSSELFEKTWRPQELGLSAVERSVFILENISGGRPRRRPRWVDQTAEAYLRGLQKSPPLVQTRRPVVASVHFLLADVGLFLLCVCFFGHWVRPLLCTKDVGCRCHGITWPLLHLARLGFSVKFNGCNSRTKRQFIKNILLYKKRKNVFSLGFFFFFADTLQALHFFKNQDKNWAV